MAEENRTDEDQSTGPKDATDDSATRTAGQPQGSSADSDDDADPEGSDQLGDAGKRALDSMKDKRKAAQAERDRYKTELDAARAELKTHTDKDKTETQRLQEERDSYKTTAEKAQSALKRREVAEEHAPEHATPAQIKAVAKRLTGDTDEALAEDAAELFALLAPQQDTPKPASRPKERLRGGGDPDEGSEETDPAKLAALIPRRR